MRTLETRLNRLEATAPPETPHHAVQLICESEAEGEAKIAAMRTAGEIFPHTLIIQRMIIDAPNREQEKGL